MEPRRHISSGTRVIAVAGLFLALAMPAQADFDYMDFSNPAGINLVGNGQVLGNFIRLSEWVGQQVGAMWVDEQQNVGEAFSTTMVFRIAPEFGATLSADGMAFVIQNSDPNAIVSAGGSLGYSDEANPDLGIPNCIAIELDTWSNTTVNDPDDNHISVHTRGSLPNSVNEADSIGITSAIPTLADGSQHTLRVDYEPGILTIFLDDLTTPALVVDADLVDICGSDFAWLGVTGTTGGVVERNDVLSWSFTGGGGGAPTFIRGDFDGSGDFNGLVDALASLSFQFQGGTPPPCAEASDSDGDGAFNGLVDSLYTLAHQFQGAEPPPAPYPTCGPDPDPATGLGCAMGCP